MPAILLDDVLPVARQESFRMHHYYIGVEHLFIALMKLRGSIAMRLLQENEQAPELVINMIRLKIGKGVPGTSPSYAEFPRTPRAEKVLTLAAEIARSHEHNDIDERDLLLAILGEQDSLTVRVLKALQLDIEKLFLAAQNKKQLGGIIPEPPVRIEFAPAYRGDRTLPKGYITVLRRMFFGYSKIIIEQQLSGGYSRARLFIVTPVQDDHEQHAAVVVKIARRAEILDEAQRYEKHVKNTVPPMCPRLEEKPVSPETTEDAGLKYTLVVGADGLPRDLRVALPDLTPRDLGIWLREQLYPTFGKNWWMQARPSRFEARREYDWLLPPILTLEHLDVTTAPRDRAVLGYPMRHHRLTTLSHGDPVTLEGFIVQKVDRENRVLTLALGTNAGYEHPYRVRVRAIDLEKSAFYPGEVVEALHGYVWETRAGHLMMSARDLLPDFNLSDDYIPATPDRMQRVQNPLLHYDTLLGWYINGSISRIHGDMHPGNIMLGPGNTPFLIDFAFAREGHAIFDWACLEISLLNELVMPTVGQEWTDVRQVIAMLMKLNAEQPLPGNSPLAQALVPIVDIRRIVREMIERVSGMRVNWMEYYIALTMCALRAIHWETMPLASRRLMFLVAGLSIHELREIPVPTNVLDSHTPSPEEADISTSTSV